ncbi:M20 family metallopeptidase [Aurantibacter crassamenti]|uniref:M20 family metallopeptidase n=1 Tax=Aurantibacter crassamenti TaxID=1837375 RepID=UPI00193A0517|nr:M20 family metallopeptidase [Aurantibacter crassamenti]MBM1107781.1 M20 family metallopeptidase [Aurantibacter crassamenti]
MSEIVEQLNVIELTQKLISFNTINPPGNEGGLAVYIGELLLKNGFEVDYPIYAKDRLQLVATKGLSIDKPPILFTGHLDVVPLGANEWTKDPFAGEIIDNKLYGRGSTDMKAGVAAMIVAAIETYRYDSPKGGIKLVFTADEELGCNGAQHLCQSGYDLGEASAMVVGEPTGNLPFIGHKGGLYLNAYTKGITAHSSMPELGDNAIYKASRAIVKIEDLKFEAPKDELLGYPTINVGRIEGGLNLNSVPDKAAFTIDVRTTTAYKNDKVWIRLKELFGEEVSLEKITDLNAISTSEKNDFIKIIFDILEIDSADKSVKKSANFLTDASVFMPHLNNIPTIILGPGEPEMAHQTDEFCYVDKIEKAVEIYNAIIIKNSTK